MRSKYDDEALSRILGEHAAGQLVTGGHPWVRFGPPSGCVNQAAFNEDLPGQACMDYGRRGRAVAGWFDRCYQRDMSPEELLVAIVMAS